MHNETRRKEKHSFESEIKDKAKLIREAQDWAEKTYGLDQRRRSEVQETITEGNWLNDKLKQLGIDDMVKYKAFLQSDPSSADEIAFKERLQRILDRSKEMGSDEEDQVSLRALIKKIGGFPSIHEYGQKTSDTAWLVLQHAKDIEFQKQGLKLMLECRNHNPGVASVGLTNLYYLIDRITVASYRYQFFGTQYKEENQELKQVNLIALPENFKTYFEQNPALFCTSLTLREYPEELRVEPNDSDLLYLWRLAAHDNAKYEIEYENTDENVKKYEKKLEKLKTIRSHLNF